MNTVHAARNFVYGFERFQAKYAVRNLTPSAQGNPMTLSEDKHRCRQNSYRVSDESYLPRLYAHGVESRATSTAANKVSSKFAKGFTYVKEHKHSVSSQEQLRWAGNHVNLWINAQTKTSHALSRGNNIKTSWSLHFGFHHVKEIVFLITIKNSSTYFTGPNSITKKFGFCSVLRATGCGSFVQTSSVSG